MHPAPPMPVTPAEEAERLRALQPYKHLEVTHNPVFTQVAQLAARLFAVPLAQVSLVDAEEVRYPGNVGDLQLPSCLRRADSICATAVYRPDGGPTVYDDLHARPCPWLPTELQQDLGFYAGCPLRTRAGQPIGTLCLLDCMPHSFGPDQQAVLQRLAGIAMQLLDLHLLADPTQAPAIWKALAGRIELSLQRIDTLVALARWEATPDTPSARAYAESTRQERLLIVQDIEYQLAMSFKQLEQL